MLPRLHKFFQKNKEGIFSNSLDKTSNLYSKTGQDQCKKKLPMSLDKNPK